MAATSTICKNVVGLLVGKSVSRKVRKKRDNLSRKVRKSESPQVRKKRNNISRKVWKKRNSFKQKYLSDLRGLPDLCGLIRPNRLNRVHP
jgi:hypothetical protein